MRKASKLTFSEYAESRKRLSKRADARNLLKASSFADVETLISVQIKDLLERDASWEDRVDETGAMVKGINTRKDPLLLLNLIKKVVGTGMYGMKETDKYTVMIRYHACKQGNASLPDYQRTFKDQVSYLRAVGYDETRVPEDELAMQYIHSLNSQFQVWRDELAKLSLMDRKSRYPDTLAKAMEDSVSYAKIMAGSAAKAAVKPMFALEEGTDSEYCLPLKPKPKQGAETDGGAKPEPKTVKVPRAIIESQEILEGDNRRCRACGEAGHLWKACAVRIFKEEQKKIHEADTIFCMGALIGRDASSPTPDDSDEESHDLGGYRRDKKSLKETEAATLAAANLHLAMAVELGVDSAKRRSRQETLEVFAATKMGPHMAGLDTMSALCGTANRSLVANLRVRSPLQLFGIGGTCDVTEVGTPLNTDIDMWARSEGYPTIHYSFFKQSFNIQF